VINRGVVEIIKQKVLIKFIHKIYITYQNGLSKLMMSKEFLQPKLSPGGVVDMVSPTESGRVNCESRL